VEIECSHSDTRSTIHTESFSVGLAYPLAVLLFGENFKTRNDPLTNLYGRHMALVQHTSLATMVLQVANNFINDQDYSVP
jgi:hypothetical protein